MILLLRPDGRVEAIAHPEADRALEAALGTVVAARRTGWVEPAGWSRGVFRLLRGRLVGRWAWARALSRRLPGPWQVRLTDGRLLGPFPSRAEAVAAEEEAGLLPALLPGGPPAPPAWYIFPVTEGDDGPAHRCV